MTVGGVDWVAGGVGAAGVAAAASEAGETGANAVRAGVVLCTGAAADLGAATAVRTVKPCAGAKRCASDARACAAGACTRSTCTGRTPARVWPSAACSCTHSSGPCHHAASATCAHTTASTHAHHAHPLRGAFGLALGPGFGGAARVRGSTASPVRAGWGLGMAWWRSNGAQSGQIEGEFSSDGASSVQNRETFKFSAAQRQMTAAQARRSSVVPSGARSLPTRQLAAAAQRASAHPCPTQA